MRQFIFIFIICNITKSSLSQCYYQGYAYNVGTILTIDGVKKKCSCIIDVKPYQPCNSSWVVINPPSSPTQTARPQQPNTTPYRPTSYAISTSFPNVQAHGFYKVQLSDTFLTVNFKGTLNITIKKPYYYVGSYDDLIDVELEGSYEGTCDKVQKMINGDFVERTRQSDAPFTKDQIAYRNEWIGQKVKIQFKAKSSSNLFAKNQDKIGLKFDAIQNALIRYNKGLESTSQLDLNKLQTEIYFEPNKRTNTTLPISVSLNERGVAEGIREQIDLHYTRKLSH